MATTSSTPEGNTKIWILPSLRMASPLRLWILKLTNILLSSHLSLGHFCWTYSWTVLRQITTSSIPPCHMHNPSPTLWTLPLSFTTSKAHFMVPSTLKILVSLRMPLSFLTTFCLSYLVPSPGWARWGSAWVWFMFYILDITLKCWDTEGRCVWC